ncbi:MAG: carbamate kinase [Mycoplasmatales bacterium]
MSANDKVVVIALGGNALQISGEDPTYENQRKNIVVAMQKIVELIKKGYKVVITHGNGPQVGRLLIQQAKAESDETPSFPFDAVDAMSQATIGYQIEQVLQNELKKENIIRDISTIITQVEVDLNDEAFLNPSKPIGPFYEEEEANSIAKKSGFVFKPDSNRGHRRVVASPEPKEIIEFNAIKTLLDSNQIVICCGGGGIPVIVNDSGYQGVAAVIDKDKATNLLAKKLNADYLVILTAVENAAIHFGKENQEVLNVIDSDTMLEYIKQGHFAKGSMLEKVESTVDFVNSTNKTAIITSLDVVTMAIETELRGTIIKRSFQINE